MRLKRTLESYGGRKIREEEKRLLSARLPTIQDNIKQNRLCCKTTEKVPLSLGGFMLRKLPVNWVFMSLSWF